MLSPESFHNLVSGRQRGLRAALLRGFLRVAETPYTWAMRWRNSGYDRGRRPIQSVSVPVISVGNLTLGGTGKTPFVAWLARWFRERGVRVTLISRGYGAEEGHRNDEAKELELKLPDVPHVQNPDRVSAANMAIEEFECQLILLDDAFQHRRIGRDLDIVLLDALEPFGYDHVFPRGLLREPVAGLRRAQVIALSRADAVSVERRAEIRAVAERHAPQALWLEIAQQPRALLNATGERKPLGDFAGQNIAAFCGIGNPAGFRHTLDQSGVIVRSFRDFPDHHAYTREDIGALTTWASDNSATAILCTQKDLVKLELTELGSLPLWAVEIETEFLAGQNAFEEKLKPVLLSIAPCDAEQ